MVAGGGFKVKVPKRISNPGHAPSAREALAAKQASMDAHSGRVRAVTVLTGGSPTLSAASPGRVSGRRRGSSVHSLAHVPNTEVVYHGSAGFADRVVNSPAATALLRDLQRREGTSPTPLDLSPGGGLDSTSHLSI